MVTTSDSWSGIISQEGFAKLHFNYFNGANEGIIGEEAEIKGFTVKCGGRLLEGGGMWIPVRLPLER